MLSLSCLSCVSLVSLFCPASRQHQLPFEAAPQLPEEDRKIVKALIEGMVIKYQARRMVENLSS